MYSDAEYKEGTNYPVFRSAKDQYSDINLGALPTKNNKDSTEIAARSMQLRMSQRESQQGCKGRNR
jgi:hypothetical protein